MSLDSLAVEVNDVANVVRGVANDLHNVAFNSIVGLLPGVGSVLKHLSDAVNAVLNRIIGIGNHVKDQISKQVGNLVPAALDFISGFIGGIAQDIHWVINNLATAEDFAAGFLNTAAQYMPGIAKALEGAISGALGSGLLGLFKFLEGQDRETIDHLLDDLAALPNLPPWLKSMLGGVRKRGAEWQIFALPAIVASLLIGVGHAYAAPIVKQVEQNSNWVIQSEVRSPAALVELRLKGLITQEVFLDEMRLNNFNNDRAKSLLDGAYERLLPEEAVRLHWRGGMSQELLHKELEERGITQWRSDAKLNALRPILDEETTRNIYLRGLINEEQHDALMRLHGYSDDVINHRKSVYYLIPPPNDLIHMAIRNVFSPEIVERFKLFGDFPPAFEKAAAQQGISKEWALRYWGAHWIVPSNQEGFDMFHRTTTASEDEHADTFTLSDGTKVQNVIGRSTLQLLLREKDTAPYYRAKITEIAYNPLTRIDVRRMHKVGSLTHAGVQRAYLDLGYSPANALRLADYVEKLNAQEGIDKSRPLIDGLARRILTLYQQEKLDLSDAAFAFKDLGFKDAETDFYLAEANLVRATEDAQEVETGIGKLYTSGYITADAATTRLKAAGVTEAAIKRLFSKWQLTIEFSELKADHAKARELTKSEIITARKDGLITDADFLVMLKHLGYDDVSAGAELAVAKFQAATAERKAQTDAIKSLYVNNQRTYLETVTALDGLKISSVQRDALLAEWSLLREQRVATIPIATIRDMLKAEFLTRPQGEDHLRRHKYNDADIAALINFWLQPNQSGGRKRGTVTGG